MMKDLGSCEYLVIGAGAASIAFIDTLITELPNVKIVLVDKRSAPGGHWVDAYGFVQLHQPSLLYGVASEQLEGNWLKLLLTRGILPWNHRASKAEILLHYERLIQKWIKQGNLQYFPKTVYDFSSQDSKRQDDFHTFQSLDGTEKYQVKVEVKLVNGILGECRIPSQMPVQFPVAEHVKMMTPNDLYDMQLVEDNKEYRWYFPFSYFTRGSSIGPEQPKKYVVLGGGKTGMDTIVFLQRTMGVPPENISWVIPHDVWMLVRNGSGSPWSYADALLETDLDFDAAGLLLEKQGKLTRLDENIKPTAFRFPVVGDDELVLMKQIKNVIRKGRVTSIVQQSEKKVGDEEIVVHFGPEQEPLIVSSDHVFVHCTSPGPFNGNGQLEIFPTEKVLNLLLLFAPPVPFSMSCLGKLESCRRKGELDIDFGRELLVKSGTVKANDHGRALSENEVLKNLVTGYDVFQSHVPGHNKDGTDKHGFNAHLHPLKLLAVLVSLMAPDPLAGVQWMQRNRLSFFSIPGVKTRIYENISQLSQKGNSLGFAKEEVQMLKLLAERLQPLEGK